jgi:dienelactone hydrolase
MLALHPEWLQFGELGDIDYKHNRSAYLDLCGLSGLSVFYLAVRGGLDVLLDQAATDAHRVAMTGLSGGGWQTIILGALDKQISVLVPNAGHIGLDQRVAHRSDIGDLEQNPTDLVSIADYTHLTAMLAPRPTLLIYNEKDDCCFVSERAKPSVFDPVVPFFRLFDREEDFEYYENTKPGTHNYDRDNRQQFYRFIQDHLHPDAPIGVEIPSEAELLSQDQLEMGLPEDNANFFTLAQAQLSSLPKDRPPTDDPSAVRKWQEVARSRLLNLLKLKPMRAKATTVRRAAHGEMEAAWYRFTVGETCSISALAVSKSTPQNTVIVFADAGRAAMEGIVKEQIETGSRVIAVDPLFMGECTPNGAAPSHYAMMIGTVGERALGLQVDQIDAVVKWACQQYGVERVSVHSSGWTAGITALMVAGLNPDRIDRVVVQNGLPSLKRLIEDRLEYERYPTLFCFGLLEQFDVEELVALCLPRKVIFQ